MSKKYVGFKVLRSLYTLADVVSLRSLSGIAICDVEDHEDDFDSCAHISTIVMKGKKMELEGARMVNFILKHDDFTHPNIVFEDNVTLMSIDGDYAIFAVCDVNVHSHADVGPFFYINQFEHCKKLITVPLHHFVRLMDTVRPNPAESLNLILLSNTGRCGSTLMTQMFEQLPGTVAISEPEALMPFAMENKRRKDVTRTQLLRACMTSLCYSAVNSVSFNGKKPESVKNIVIKPKAHAIGLTKELAELYPHMRHLFLYRHPAEYVKSLASVFSSLLHPLVHSAIMRISIKMSMSDLILRQFPVGGEGGPQAKEMRDVVKRLDLNKNVNKFVSLFCANLLSAQQQHLQNGIDFKVVSYHELTKQPDPVMHDVAHFCAISDDKSDANGNSAEVSEGVELPESDSQDKSALSRQHLQNFRRNLTDSELRAVDAVLTACGLPDCSTFPVDSASLDALLRRAL